MSPHSKPEIELLAFNYVFFNTTRRRADPKLRLMMDSPAETPNSIKRRKCHPNSLKITFANKEQFPSISHKRKPEAPRSAAGFLLRYL